MTTHRPAPRQWLGVSPRLWLGVATAAWAVFLLVAATYAARTGRPTDVAQTTIVQALPVMDRALGVVAAAVTGPQTVLSVSGYERVQAGCDVGNRDGDRYERSVLVHVAPGQEAALVDRVAAALPASYRPTVRHAGAVHGLRADAGFYVRLTGGVTRPGELRFIADSGCRVRGGDVPAGSEEDRGPLTVHTATLDPMLKLHTTRTGQRVSELACASGGSVWTVAVSTSKPTGQLPAAVPDGVAPLISTDDLLVYVHAVWDVGVAVALRGDGLQITASLGCHQPR